jgi:predicted outer membrane repeat protein
MISKLFFVILVVMLVFNVIANCSDYYVNVVSGSDSNPGTSADYSWKTITYAVLQIEGSEDNQAKIHLANGSYNPTSGETFPIQLKSYISLIGNDREKTIIDAGGAGSNVLAMNYAESVFIEGVTIRGTIKGSGIYIEQSSLSITDCIVRDNKSNSWGGSGINTLYSSSLSIKDCLVYNNISDNDDSDGGGIYCSESDLTVENCEIRDNHVGSEGGGIYCRTANNISIRNTTINNNIAMGREGFFVSTGGGLYVSESQSTLVENSIISGNCINRGSGGGIYCGNNTTIRNCIIENNRAEKYKNSTGGGISIYGSGVIEKCQITGNFSNYAGGGISCSGNITVIDNVISENIAQIGAGLNCGNNTKVINCSITNNHSILIDYDSGLGGGLYLTRGYEIFIDKCEISGNTADAFGGGVYNFNLSAAVLSGCDINNNTAKYGGGIYCLDSILTYRKCSIKNNQAIEGSGGGIYCENASPSFNKCEIDSNIANNGGGGIYCYYSSPMISECMILNNAAYLSQPTEIEKQSYSSTDNQDGGGIYCDYFSSPSVIDCELTGNTSILGGGIYCQKYSDPDIKNCLFVQNSAQQGESVYCYYGSSPKITNSTILHNSQIAIDGITSSEGSLPIVTNSIIWGYNTRSITGQADVTYSDIEIGYNGEGNIDSDPIFVKGPKGDYYLSQIVAGQKVDSPCVDAGKTTASEADTDLKTTRIDGVFDTKTVDIGYHYLSNILFDLHFDKLKNIFRNSDNIRLLLDINMISPNVNVDLYFILITPDGCIFSGMDWSSSIKPMITNLYLSSDLAIDDMVLLDATIPIDNPPISMVGEYEFIIACIKTNTTEFISNISSSSINLVESTISQ